MKKLILSLFIVLTLPALAIDFSVNFTGSPDSEDILAAELLVENENQKRIDEAAADDPPGTPIILPFGTNAEKKSSYLEVLTALLTRAHLSYKDQAKKAKEAAIPAADRKNLSVEVKGALDRGVTAEQIAAAIAALN